MSVPGNQIFVKYEISSTVARRKGFTAFIQRIGISSYYGRGTNQNIYITVVIWYSNDIFLRFATVVAVVPW